MPDTATPFDPKPALVDGIALLSSSEWVEMTTFFDAAVTANPTSEEKMRKTLGMEKSDAFKAEFRDAVSLYEGLAACGTAFKTNVQDKMLLLADDIVQYNDVNHATYDRLIDLVDRFDWDGAPTGATPDEKWAALVTTWDSGTPQGRSEQIRKRFSSALETLITEAADRASRAETLQRAILAPDGIVERLKTSRVDFANQKARFDKVFGEESSETVTLRTAKEALEKELASLRKKESDEVLVLETSPVYLVIPLFGPLILAAVDVGTGVDLALTREKIASITKKVEAYAATIEVNERFIGYYTSVSKDITTVAEKITSIAPKLETLGKAWRAVASDLTAVKTLLAGQGRDAVEGENWFKLVPVLGAAKSGWERVAAQADRFRKFGGTPLRKDDVVSLVAVVTDRAA